MKEILNFHKFFGAWSPKFKQGYDDFLWDRGIQSQDPEYLQGYEKGKTEREECLATRVQKPVKKPKTKKAPKGFKNKKVLEKLSEGKDYTQVAKEVGCTVNYAYRISKGIV